MEQINLVVGILSKVWPYEETDEYDFVQGLFSMMHALFSQSRVSPENQRNSELRMFNLCYSLISYLYFLVTKKFLRLQTSNSSSSYTSSVELQQPTLSLLNSLFSSVTTALERAAEEKSLLLNKIQDINELSRQEVDEIINMCVRQDSVSSSDNILKSSLEMAVLEQQKAGENVLKLAAEQKVYNLSISGHVRGGGGVLWCCISEFINLNGVSEGGVVGKFVCMRWTNLNSVHSMEMLPEDECCVWESGSKLKDEYQRKGFNPRTVCILLDLWGHLGTAVVEFDKNWTGLDNALAFEREYELDHGKKDWFANIELKSGINAWIARAEDYKMNNIIREQLQKMDVITISQLMEVEARIWLLVVLQTEDEDMIYMYNAYLHKLITCFLSNPLARDKIKESKEWIMSVLSPYRVVGSHDFAQDNNSSSLHDTEMESLSFNSILDFKEPELLSGNDVLWTFVNFAGEDHTNFQTLVAFLNMLSTLACNQEGASKVYELLQGKAFCSIGWSTLFECLTIYDEKFKQSLQTVGAMLPEIQEGDAKALVAYLNVLKKVVENGTQLKGKPGFLILNHCSSFLVMKMYPLILSIWTYLEQYDLPVVVGPDIQNSPQSMVGQHLDTIGIALLPKRNSNQSLRNSSLHQVFPFTLCFQIFESVAVELHAGDVRSSNHREACQTILSFVFAHGMNDIDASENTATRTVNKSKEKDHICKPGTGSISLADWVSERGAMVGTGCHDHPVKQGKDIPTDDQECKKKMLLFVVFYSPFMLNFIPITTLSVYAVIFVPRRTKCTLVVSELLEIIQFRCLDSTAQLSNIVAGMKYDLQAKDILGNPGNSGKGGVYYYSERGDRLIDLASFHDKLWQIVEVFASRRLTMLEDRSEILFQVLDASLSASGSSECSLKMPFILSQVALTCMAKLRDERFLFPGSLSSDNITSLDLIVVKQLSNGVCLTILQYLLLLSYFQYCQNVVDPDVPTTVLQFLLLNEQDNEYIDLPKFDKEQAELARANFSTLRKEAQSVLNLVICYCY
ncbi:hypothetical protein VNO78_06849 [Psophocarpus tetragonolobus]|uniref:XS domain-containing protein n=1 Tax=Psophocarpus tetragonolobus TaxID=3891 RepID=A0AAN9T246_PSOTE